MKKNAKIVANDGNGIMEVTIRYRSKYSCLTAGETKRMVTKTAENVADAIRNTLYHQYGPSNTIVSV